MMMRVPCTRVAGTMLVVGMLCGPGRARAQSGLAIPVIVAEPESAATVTEDRVLVRCQDESEDEFSCELERRIAIENATGAPVTFAGRVRGGHASVAILRDGAQLSAARKDDSLELRLPPHQRVIVVLTTAMQSSGSLIGDDFSFNSRCMFSDAGCAAMKTRHWLLAAPSGAGRLYAEIPVALPMRSNIPITVELDVPSHFRVRTKSPVTKRERGSQKHGRQTITYRIIPSEQRVFDPHATQAWFEVEMTRKLRLPRGGPFLSAGGVLHGGAIGRLGYDQPWLSEPVALLTSFAIETDFREEIELAATLDMATGCFFVFPSLGLGLGTVVEVHPDSRAALRLQASLHFPLVGLELLADHFRNGGWRIAFLGRVSI